jgi:hypothetical protein
MNKVVEDLRKNELLKDADRDTVKNHIKKMRKKNPT